MLKKFLISASLLLSAPAFAQNVQQAGSVTRNHIPVWNTSGVIGDGGSSADSPISSIGVTNNGGAGFCISTQRQSASGRQQLCFGASDSAAATISLQNFGTDSPQALNFVVNGTVFPFPASLASITIGSTPVIGGTNNNCLITLGGLVGQTNCAILASGTTGSGAIVLQTSPTLAGTIGGNLIWSGSQIWNGTASFSNNLVVNGTNSPASQSDQTVVMGTVSPPVLTNTGQAWLFNSAATGANLQGDGSNFDISILNSAGSVIMQVPTGTINPTFAGVPVMSGLGSASCVNGLGLDSSNRMITVSCPGAASSIQVGTTLVVSGTPNFLLYDNAGSLGNATIASFLTAGTGMAITGTTNATIALTTPVGSANGGTGNSSPAAHTMPINEGSGSQNNTGTSIAGQAVMGNGASADPTFKSGPWTLLNTLVAATSATLGDTSSLTSAYNDYEIVFENIVPATNTVNLELQVHASSAFQATAYLTETITTAGGSQSYQQNTTFIQLALNQANAAPGISGKCNLFGPLGAAIKQWTCHTAGNVAGASLQTMTSGYWNSATLIDGLQILFSSGNITSGTMKIYGRL